MLYIADCNITPFLWYIPHDEWYILCDSKVISRALLEIVYDVNLNKPFNHKSNAPIKEIAKCKNLDFDEHFMPIFQSLDATMVLINSKWREDFFILWLSYCGFCAQLISKFQCYLQMRKSRKSPQVCRIMFYVCYSLPYLNKFLVVLHEGEHKALYDCIWLRKCWNFRRMWMRNCWQMASTSLSNP